MSTQIYYFSGTVGFVFPIHCLCVPFFVKRFLRKVNLESASYLFAITSRECSAKVFSEADQVISKQNRRLDACFSVQPSGEDTIIRMCVPGKSFSRKPAPNIKYPVF